MIRIYKGAEPSLLLTNKESWTRELLSVSSTGSKIPDSIGKRYNHPEVKDSLREECRSKCMYCESKVEHISDLHIEHIKPKARDKFPELTFEYSNLGLACPVCNRGKSDTYDADVPFINPYVDDPVNHFEVCGVFVWAKAGDDRAKLTENEIGLNRPDLVEARAERLRVLRDMVDLYVMQPNVTVKESIKKQILIEVGVDKVYSLVLGAYVSARLA